MIILASAMPLCRVEDGRVIMSIPSGKKDCIEIAFTANQALHGSRALEWTAVELMSAAAPCDAEVIRFPAGRRKARRA